jgi:hypothetical protein
VDAILLPFLPGAAAGRHVLKRSWGANSSGAGITIRMPEVRKPKAVGFCDQRRVSFMTRRIDLYVCFNMPLSLLSVVVSKKLTNNFLTFPTFVVSPRCSSLNPDVIGHFLSIPHAIG